MTRFASPIFITSIFLICLASGCKTEKKRDQTAENGNKSPLPNIVYILADDLGYGDLSIYGQKKFSTPNIDRMAAQGMLFTQHYAGNTVCAPSRSALMTGMHTGHTFVRGNKEVMPEGQYPIPESTYTLAEMLKKAGYVTGAFGKWGLGYPGSEGDPNAQGFDTFYGYNCQRLGHHYYPHHLWSNQDSLVLEENANFKKGVYGPELIHEKTLEFIDTNKSRPFFLYVPSIIPHAELAAPEHIIEKYRGKYDPEKAYQGVDDEPDFTKGRYGSQKEPHASFAAMIEILDVQVGEIMNKLEALGIADNTIVFFTSDNGPHEEAGADPEYFNSNGPLRGFKRDLYEGGIRVPMIAKWPGQIAPGSITDQVSAFWDVFPTVAEIAGVEDMPTIVDGISFLPTLLGNSKNQEDHEYLYWEFHEKGGRQAVRMGDWKGVKYGVLENPDTPMELYNLSKDIAEENNIAAEQPEIVGQLEEIFKSARTPSEVFAFGQDTYLEEK